MFSISNFLIDLALITIFILNFLCFIQFYHICYLSESRSSGPVKVLKRKLIKTPSVNQFKKQLVKRKIYPHILPEQQPSIPSYPNTTLDIQQNIPAKPSDAKRCKIYFLNLVSLEKVFIVQFCLSSQSSLSKTTRASL